MPLTYLTLTNKYKPEIARIWVSIYNLPHPPIQIKEQNTEMFILALKGGLKLWSNAYMYDEVLNWRRRIFIFFFWS